MQSLVEFFEKETNKKINIFKYNTPSKTNNPTGISKPQIIRPLKLVFKFNK